MQLSSFPNVVGERYLHRAGPRRPGGPKSGGHARRVARWWVLAFAGATAYAELGSLRPRAGGGYVYLREAFGPLAGFLTGWLERRDLCGGGDAKPVS